MSVNLLRLARRRLAPRGARSATDAGRLHSEPLFLCALARERKRAERSGRAFVLMLLDADVPVPSHRAVDLAKAASVILASLRDTDVAGWHSADRVLGVIFTELGDASPQLALTSLRARVTAALRSAVSAEHLDHIRLSFHCFPESALPSDTRRFDVTILYPDLIRHEALTRAPRLMKRIVDVTASVVGLIVACPLLLAIAIAVKLTSPGPVLFRQQRIGQYGVPFTFLKFRAMHVASDPQIHRAFVTGLIEGRRPSPASGSVPAVYKLTADPRVTPVGRLLRRTSLDELPQLLHVLRGEMSLVGPRPPIAYEVDAYHAWHRPRILATKPGITGLWQVSGRCRLPFDDMVRLDLRYARSWSLWLDLTILLRTPRAVLSGEGAY